MEPTAEAFVKGDRRAADAERHPASADRISYSQLFDRLQNPNAAIKILCEVG